MSERDLSVNIGLKTIIQGILLLGLIWFLFVMRDLVLIVITAVVIASAIEPGVLWFVRRKIPRIAAVALVYLTVIGSIFSLFFFFVPPILDEAANFVTALPQVVSSLGSNGPLVKDSSALLNSTHAMSGSLSALNVISSIRDTIANVSGGLVTTVSGVFGGLVSFVLIIVFSFYFAVQDTGVDDFLRIVTPLKHEKYILSLWKRSQVKIGRWMQGQLLLGVIVGVLVYLGLMIFGVRYALLLAILAGVFELIPVFGPILSAVPGVAIAFVDGGVPLALLIVGLYLIIQQFESHLIYPLVVTKVVGVPPLLVILALLVGAQLAGFLGIILSAPVAAVIQEYVSDRERAKRAGVAT